MIIRPTTERDFKLFEPSPEDIAEAHAYGIEPSFPPASECVTLWGNGVPLAMGGNVGSQCWFVTSYHVNHLSLSDRKAFRKRILEYRNKMLKVYPILWNYVWIGNKFHVRFLKTIGAKFHDEFTHGGQFQLFTIGRPL